MMPLASRYNNRPYRIPILSPLQSRSPHGQRRALVRDGADTRSADDVDGPGHEGTAREPDRG